jgi:hypothetical protein
VDLNEVGGKLKKLFMSEFFKVIDRRLSDMVLIERQLIEEWRKQ